MDKILKGIVRYSKHGKKQFLSDIEKFNSNTIKPSTVFISCIDCRVLSNKLTNPASGEVFFAQNPGNMVPHFEATMAGQPVVSAEGGALELGVVVKGIRNVAVCGHSDCKAMTALYGMRNCCDYTLHHPSSPLMTWVALHGKSTADRFCGKSSGQGVFDFILGGKKFKASIDPEGKLSEDTDGLRCTAYSKLVMLEATHF